MNPSKQQITLADVAGVMEIAASQSDSGVAFRAVDDLAKRTVGHTLFTVMRNLASGAEVERVYSGDPAAYPVGGRKKKEGTRWGGIVLDRGEVFLAPDPAALRAAYPDYELIFSLGIGAILNVPICHAGRCIGTMNLCGDAGQYSEADIPTGKLLAGLLVPMVMAAP
jgi:GAF domain-containing protein